MEANKSWSLGFEFVDIEIIDHKKENKASIEKWNCDQCSLFFLSKDKLDEHKKKHVPMAEEIAKCRYCNKALNNTEGSRESYSNRKCETCEYRCSKCPQRFLRHSSLLNHEKNHLTKKKKNILSNKRNTDQDEPNNGKYLRVPKKRLIEPAVAVEKLTDAKIKEAGKRNTEEGLSPKKKRNVSKVTEKPSLDKSANTLESNNKDSKRPLRSNRLEEEKTPDIVKNKQSSNINNNTSATVQAITSSTDNVVNYRPFSCHVCGETFASDNALLRHIQSHGGNAAKCFKCKHCGDEFADIYKMQYHLAICKLAEDELDSTIIMQNVPPKFLAKKPASEIKSVSGGTSATPRKRGRPKKTIETLENVNGSDQTPTLSTRGSLRRRNIEATEPVRKTPKVTKNLLPKRRGRKSLKPVAPEPSSDNEFVDEDDYNDYQDNMEEDPFEEPGAVTSNEPLDDSFESGDDDKKKHHKCPFPRCGIKFTREKALLCHMRNHNDDFDDALKCHKCDIPFDDLQSLRIHINICKGIKEEKDDDFDEPEYDEPTDKPDKPVSTYHKTKGNFMCKICGRVYITQERLKRHQELHHASSNYVCRICKDVFNNQLLLDQHFSIKHPTKSPFHCNTCKEDFISELFLQIHESDYHKKGPALKSTERTLEENPEETPQTNTPKESLRIKILKRHKYSSTVGNNRFTNRNKNQFWCPVCLASFNERENMRLHFCAEHVFETGSAFVCPVCEVEKLNAEMMSAHLEVHSANLLSVNRFSKLRACVTRDEKERYDNSLNISTNTIWIKSEKTSDEEREVEIAPETDKSQKKNMVKGRRYESLKEASNRNQVHQNKKIQLINLATGITSEVRSAIKLDTSLRLAGPGRCVSKKPKKMKIHQSSPLECIANAFGVHTPSTKNDSLDKQLTKRTIRYSTKDNILGMEKKTRPKSLIIELDNKPNLNKNKLNRLKTPLRPSLRKSPEVFKDDEIDNKNIEGQMKIDPVEKTDFIPSVSNDSADSSDTADLESIRNVPNDKNRENETDLEITSTKQNSKTKDNKENSDKEISNDKAQSSSNESSHPNEGTPCDMMDTKGNVQNKELKTNGDIIGTGSEVEREHSNEVRSDVDENQLLSANVNQPTAGEAGDIPSAANLQLTEEDSRFTSSESEVGEEICCTMCSLSFFNQDELLDHVATHI